MGNAPNLNVDHDDAVMFFIDPQVFLPHHFIVCPGNVAKNRLTEFAGRFNSLMTEEDALMEALRAVHNLKGIIRAGVDQVPTRNEIAVFAAVESNFIYPHLAVLQHSPLRAVDSPYSKYVFEVDSTTRRHEAGRHAIRLTRKSDWRVLAK